MGLETATYISGLNSSNPDGADVRSQGDDHLRLIKATLLATLPNASRAFRFPVTTALKVANFSVDATTGDNTVFPVDATSGSITVTLPSSPATDGFTVRIVKWDSSANTVVVDGGPNDLGIDNTVTIYLQDQALDFVWSLTLTKWIVLGPIGSILTTDNSPDLAAIEALSSTGIPKRTGSNTWAIGAGVGDLANSTANSLFGTNGSGNPGAVGLVLPAVLAGGTFSINVATTSAVGVIRQADKAAMEARTADRAVTADRQHDHPGHPKAWAHVTISGGVVTVNANYGITSVSKNSSGNFTVTMSTAMSSTAYAVVGNAGFGTTGGSSGNAMVVSFTDLTTTTFRVLTIDNNSDALSDAALLTFMVLGDQ